MNRHSPKRSRRLARIAAVGDVLAKVAEKDALLRRLEVETQEQRLNTISSYRDEYATHLLARETEVASLDIVKVSRQFSWWLADLASDQLVQLDQARFLFDAAKQAAVERRTFADGLGKVAQRASDADFRQRVREDQDALDDVASQRATKLAP